MKQTKSFEELFPELVGEEFDYPKDMLKTRCAIGDYEKVLSLEIIKEKCLSKQKVNEAKIKLCQKIRFVDNRCNMLVQEWDIIIDELEEELGLE